MRQRTRDRENRRYDTENKVQRIQEALDRGKKTEKTKDMTQKTRDREDTRHETEDKRQRRQET
jgi:hypothetical protein